MKQIKEEKKHKTTTFLRGFTKSMRALVTFFIKNLQNVSILKGESYKKTLK